MKKSFYFICLIFASGCLCSGFSQNRYNGFIFEKGMSGKLYTEWIMLLQYDLYYLGYGVYFDQYGGVTGEFLEQSRRAVKAFQSDHGMLADGVVGKKTALSIEKALEESELKQYWKSFNPLRYNGQRLRKGDRDELTKKSVAQLRADLTMLGFPASGDPSGVFSDETEKALKEFQEINLLPSTGLLDDRTVVALAEKICLHLAQDGDK
jgi:peptidoglycan hydrolase-like protein with peptidoglycan-binding domain